MHVQTPPPSVTPLSGGLEPPALLAAAALFSAAQQEAGREFDMLSEEPAWQQSKSPFKVRNHTVGVV